MQPDFIWRVIEIPLLNPQPSPADGCIMSAQPNVWPVISSPNWARDHNAMQQRAQHHAALLFHGATCDRARHLAFNGPVCDRRGKPGERDISAVKLQHVSSCSASHPGPLRKHRVVNTASHVCHLLQVSPLKRRWQLSLNPAWMLTTPPSLSHFNLVCFGLGSSFTC